MTGLEPSRTSAASEQVVSAFRTPMRYPNTYTWFVFVAALDIMLTWAILQRNGSEVNPIARLVIAGWGLPGAIVFKFGLTLFVILVCEVVARQADPLARRLAIASVAISSLPPAWSLALLVVHTMGG